MKKYYLSAVLLIRDEGEYIQEWIAWHLQQGIEHFYIYDNSLGGPISDFLGEISLYCTVRNTTRYRYHLQLESYVDAIRRFGKETEWMAFIDTDEFLRATGEKPLPELLKDFSDAAAILVPWVIYNANGHITKEPGLVRERFSNVVSWPWIGKMPNWKSIVHPEQVISMTAHHPDKLRDGSVIVDTNGAQRDHNFTNLPHDKLVVDHYYTKSYEEWLSRLPKGSCDPFSSRKIEWFETLNPGLLESAGITLGEFPQK